MKNRLFLLLVASLVLLPMASAADQDFQVRLEKSLKEAGAVTNLAVEWLDTMWVSKKRTTEMRISRPFFVRTFKYTFIASGPKFRSECKLISGSETNISSLDESAFDGSSYLSYSGDNNMLAKGGMGLPGANADSATCPLIAPFMFLSKHSDNCPGCVLRFTDLASLKFTKEQMPPAEQNSGGLLEFVVPGLPVDLQTSSWTILLEEAGESFTPRMIKHLFPKAGVLVVYSFLDYTNLGGYQFPTRLAWTESPYPPSSMSTLLSTGMVTVISARIPNKVADSVFKLEEESKDAALVWDYGQMKLTKTSPESTKFLTTNQRVKLGVRLVVLITCIIPLVVVIVRRIFLKGKAA